MGVGADTTTSVFEVLVGVGEGRLCGEGAGVVIDDGVGDATTLTGSGVALGEGVSAGSFAARLGVVLAGARFIVGRLFLTGLLMCFGVACLVALGVGSGSLGVGVGIAAGASADLGITLI